jgi:hypothetical protein
MKKYLLISVLSGAIILGGCAVKNNVAITPSVPNNIANPIASSAPVSVSEAVSPTSTASEFGSSTDNLVVEKNGKVLYQNNQLGFSLEFPKTWQNLIFTKDQANGVSIGKIAGGILFTTKGDDDSFFPLFDIKMYTKEQWNNDLKQIPIHNNTAGEMEVRVPTKLGENGVNIFALSYEGVQAFPGTSTEARIEGEPTIFKTFKIINPVANFSDATSSIAGTDNVLYQNYKYSFELQYPSDYKINSDMVGDPTCKNYSCKEANFEVQNGSSSVSISIFPLVYEKAAISYIGGATSTIEKDGLKVEKVVYPNGTQSPGAIWYLFDKNNKGYMMSFNTGRGTGDSEKIGQEIFDSLKFNNN